MSTSFSSRFCAGDSSSRHYKPVRGFTLVELMTVLAVVGVLLIIAVPSYSVLSLRTKLKSYANEVVASVYLARGEAIRRNAPMTMCISTNGTTCVGGGDWDQGWIVVDQKVIADLTDNVVIKYQQALPSGMKIFEEFGEHTITFQSSGILSPSVTMTICQATPDEGIEERVVTISATGRHRMATTKNGCP